MRAVTGYRPPADGLHYRWPDLPSLKIEERLQHKLDAVRAFARVNSIDRTIVHSERATVGIVTAGKAHLDFMEVLRRLDIPLQALAEKVDRERKQKDTEKKLGGMTGVEARTGGPLTGKGKKKGRGDEEDDGRCDRDDSFHTHSYSPIC